jgi:uncharacterized protein YbjT (DUF2867 family)
MAGAVLFVAGATGFTGREVVRQARQRGLTTVAHVRPDSPRLADWQDRFTALGAMVDSTAWDGPAMAALLGRLQTTHLFALIGTTRARGRDAKKSGGREDYETVDYGLTALLARAAVESGARPRLVYLSAVGAHPKARTAYMKARHRAEQAVITSGLPYIIARPSFIVGPDRDDGRVTERLGARLIDGALSLAGALGARRLRDRYRSISNVDLARVLLDLALDPDTAGRVVEAEQLQRG